MLVPGSVNGDGPAAVTLKQDDVGEYRVVVAKRVVLTLFLAVCGVCGFLVCQFICLFVCTFLYFFYLFIYLYIN